MQGVKLGITVVYLLDVENGRLLDIHLNYIRNNTKIPYKIYAACNRLEQCLASRLKDKEEVSVCPVPPTALRGSYENRYYLGHLIQTALDDGCTHIAIMHVDSFPVKDNWCEELLSRMSESCPVASVMMKENYDHKPHTSLLFFSGEFYRTYAPNLLLSPEDVDSTDYSVYSAKHPHQQDCGCGFGFALYRNKLDWVPLEQTNAAHDHYHMGSIYGDLVFHLSGVSREAKIFNRVWGGFYSGSLGRSRKLLKTILGSITPQGWQYTFKEKIAKLFFRNEHRENAIAQKQILKHLFENPEEYISYLRAGGRVAG